uniref:DNA helicase n=1 Tax=Glycine max TaxID=3847 RepID=A0A0R0J881_SOYBN
MIRIRRVGTRRSGVLPQLYQVKQFIGIFRGSFSQESPETVPAGRLPIYKQVILLISFFLVLYIDFFLMLIICCFRKSQEDIEEIENLAKDPRIRERKDIKTAIALAMFGGQEKDGEGKHRLRGDINILLLSDPGTAKSQFLKEWTLDGGTLIVLTAAVRGICLIDELDKMNDQDRHSVRLLWLQILWWKDVVDPVTDEMLATFVVDSHFESQPKGANQDDKSFSKSQDVHASAMPADPEVLAKILLLVILPQQLLKKYIIYAKLNIFPRLQDADMDKLSHVYAELWRESSHGQGVSISVRHIESMIRMSEAHARMHLRQHVTQEDVGMAIRVLLESFISTQKFGVQKALQKKDYNDLLLFILSNLVQNALHFEEIITGSVAVLTHIDVRVDDLYNKAQEHDIYDLTTFFNSSQFSRAYFVLVEEREKQKQNENYTSLGTVMPIASENNIVSKVGGHESHSCKGSSDEAPFFAIQSAT